MEMLKSEYQSMSEKDAKLQLTVKILLDLRTNQQKQKQMLLSSYDPCLKIYSPDWLEG